MPLQRIGNRSVYVLTTPRVEEAKTSTGESWATYYTNLRWRTWAEVAKSQAAMRDVQSTAYKAGMDIYEQQRRDLNRAVLDMRELKAKALAGGNTAGQIARAQRDRETQLTRLERFINAAEGESQTIRVSDLEDGMGGRIFQHPTTKDIKRVRPNQAVPEGYELVTTRTVTTTKKNFPADIIANQRQRYEELLGQTVSASDLSGGGGEPVTSEERQQGLDFIDKEIDRLETELGGLRAPTLDLQNPLEATRQAYEEQIGVMGSGGGPFGLAARRRRELPRFDSAQALQDVSDVASAYRKTALEALPSDATVDQIEAALQQAGTQAASDLTARGAEPTERGDFLLTDTLTRPRGSDQTPTTPQVAPTPVQFGDDLPEDVVQPERDDALFPSNPSQDALFLLLDNIGKDGYGMYPSDNDNPPQTAPAAPEPVAPITTPVTQSTGLDVGPATSGGTVAPASIGGLTPSPASRDIDFIANPDSVISGTDTQRQTDAERINLDVDTFEAGLDTDMGIDLVQRAKDFYKDATIQITQGAEPQPILDTFDNDKALVASYLMDQIRQNTDVQQYIPEGTEDRIQAQLEDIPETRRQRRQTRAQQKASYYVDVLSKGAKLANKPKKLERLAKKDLPKEERPEVVTIVEDLLNVSRGKKNSFKSVFDEISRYYKDDKDKMRQAHEYLAALQILDDSI